MAGGGPGGGAVRGRREAGGEAIALVEIDGGLPESILPKIRRLEHVVRVDLLQFAPLNE